MKTGRRMRERLAGIGIHHAEPDQGNAADTAAESVLPSARPAERSFASFITARMSFFEVAPSSVMTPATKS
jgi:hypothetical protein